jgi:hypothetical protein
MMQQLGIKTSGVPGGEDPFAHSQLLGQAFQLAVTSTALRNVQDPSVIKLGSNQRATVTVKKDFISRPDFFDRFRETLPDMLCARTGRLPLPRARWKDIWSGIPSSASQITSMLAKLVEQALWTLPVDFLVPEQAKCGLLAGKEQTLNTEVHFESWMAQDEEPKMAEATKKQSAKKKKKTKTFQKVDKGKPKVTKTDLPAEVPEQGQELQEQEQRQESDQEEQEQEQEQEEGPAIEIAKETLLSAGLQDEWKEFPESQGKLSSSQECHAPSDNERSEKQLDDAVLVSLTGQMRCTAERIRYEIQLCGDSIKEEQSNTPPVDVAKPQSGIRPPPGLPPPTTLPVLLPGGSTKIHSAWRKDTTAIHERLNEISSELNHAAQKLKALKIESESCKSQSFSDGSAGNVSPASLMSTYPTMTMADPRIDSATWISSHATYGSLSCYTGSAWCPATSIGAEYINLHGKCWQ